MINLKDILIEDSKKPISHKEAQDMMIEILKARWGGKDMEKYFEDKSKEFLNKLKQDIEKKKSWDRI